MDVRVWSARAAGEGRVMFKGVMEVQRATLREDAGVVEVTLTKKEGKKGTEKSSYY